MKIFIKYLVSLCHILEYRRCQIYNLNWNRNPLETPSLDIKYVKFPFDVKFVHIEMWGGLKPYPHQQFKNKSSTWLGDKLS